MYFALRRRPIGADALNGDLTVDVAYTDSMIDHVSGMVGNTIRELLWSIGHVPRGDSGGERSAG